MRCEEAKEISESHPEALSPPISLSWVLEGNPWVRKLLGSPPLRLSIPHRVLSLLLIWAAELSSHNTKNVIPPQTSKCFLGKNTSTVLWAFPTAKRFNSRFFHFFPSGSYPWNWPLAIFFFLPVIQWWFISLPFHTIFLAIYSLGLKLIYPLL